MEIPSEIRKSFQALLANSQFTSHLQQYTRSALETIYNLPQSQQIDTPAPYIILISHLISTNQSIQPFIAGLSNDSQAKVSKLIKDFTAYDNDKTLKIDNTYYHNLCDVKWEMFIENGRQIWQVKLYTFQNLKKPFILRLNYEQLSILAFQVNQIVNQITQIEKS